MDKTDNYFIALSGVKCEVDKKGPHKLNYISWSEAWSEVKKMYPKSTYKRIKNDFDNSYLFKSGTGGMCEVEVTIEEITHSIDLPVLDFKNQPVAYDQVDSFQINKTLMRAFTKAIAMHGIGLYVYRGEDLPNEETDKPRIAEKKAEFTDEIFEGFKKSEKYKDHFEAYIVIEKKYELGIPMRKKIKSYYENKIDGNNGDGTNLLDEADKPPF